MTKKEHVCTLFCKFITKGKIFRPLTIALQMKLRCIPLAFINLEITTLLYSHWWQIQLIEHDIEKNKTKPWCPRDSLYMSAFKQAFFTADIRLLTVGKAQVLLIPLTMVLFYQVSNKPWQCDRQWCIKPNWYSVCVYEWNHSVLNLVSVFWRYFEGWGQILTLFYYFFSVSSV